ncbi:MAG: beta-propeller domain-containing protein [Candidatus Dojkabacteria bacterium]|nr:beta-propeller domain-containing protein [Candidatus Dojkabacteria bacterium]MDQ7020605.1 beta-propeller domain-containing protein [Candidatus Dojkabacteria bacterium]
MSSLKELFLKRNPLSIMLILILIISILLGGIAIYNTIPEKEKSPGFNTFSSCRDIEKYIAENTNNDYWYGGVPTPFPMMEGDGSLMRDFDEAVDVTTTNSAGGESNDKNFSETNIQVAGVDEADIIKTDGDYIYVIFGEEGYIYQISENGIEEEIANFEVPGDPFEMYLDSDKLVILARESYAFSGYWTLDNSESGVFIYDIFNKSNPKLEREVKIEGDYITSRKVDDTVYFVTNKYLYDFREGSSIERAITEFSDSKVSDEYYKIAECDEISHYGTNVNSLLNVTSIPLDIESKVNNKLILGDSSNVYMSKDNLYLATVTYEYEECEGNSRGSRAVNNSTMMYDPEIIKPEYDYCYPELKDINTEVYRLAVDGTDIDFKSSGKINGTLLNQFSMDEYEENFRVVTTVNDYSGWNSDSYNNLYILNSDLDVIGEIEGLAEGEQIYSARFMGDRAYMVTFETVDPLFVLDLSDAENPKVEGELKIPGYSDYLHPYDENHIIGVGMDTAVNEWNSAVNQGIKVALFDITDVENPIVNSEVVVGGRGSYTAVSDSHKAFLFDKEKELMVIPTDINEVEKDIEVPTEEEIYSDLESLQLETFNNINVEYSDYEIRISSKISNKDDAVKIENLLKNTYGLEEVYIEDQNFYYENFKTEEDITFEDSEPMDVPSSELKLIAPAPEPLPPVESTGYSVVAYINNDPFRYGQRVFSGFTVFNINLKDGIVEKGRIGDDVKPYDSYYYSGYDARSLYVDNLLYTFINGKLRANNINDLTLLEEVRLAK